MYWTPLQVKANCFVHSASKGIEKNALVTSAVAFHLLLLPPHSFPLVPRRMGSLPQDTALDKLLPCGLHMGCCSSRSFPARDHSTGCSSSGMDCSSMGFLPGACSSMRFPWAEASFRAHLPATTRGPPHSVVYTQWCISALMWSSMGCRGTTYSPLHILLMNLCYSTWSTSFLPCPWCLQSCFSHIFSLLPLTAAAQHLFIIL